MTKTMEKSMIAAAKRFLKVNKINGRKLYEYQYVYDGFQYLINPYSIVALEEHLPLEDRPEDLPEPSETMIGFISQDKDLSDVRIVSVPNIKEVKKIVKESKTKNHYGGISYKPYDIDLEYDVNPLYLQTMMELLPNAKVTYKGMGIFYFEVENGNGILLGIRKI